jgi:hypothetical protein
MQLPLNVSPVSASFVGITHPGIHLVLCVACSAPKIFYHIGIIMPLVISILCFKTMLEFITQQN